MNSLFILLYFYFLLPYRSLSKLLIDLILDPFPGVGRIAFCAFLVNQAAYVHERVQEIE